MSDSPSTIDTLGAEVAAEVSRRSDYLQRVQSLAARVEAVRIKQAEVVAEVQAIQRSWAAEQQPV